jgi:hypothetical protein
MTRGTAYLILPDNSTIESCEFNGDMYEGGNYESFVEHLKKTTDKDSFTKEMTAFDKDVFNYQDEDGDYFQMHKQKPNHYVGKDGVIDFNEKYFDRFFSDYLFWKNGSDSPVVFRIDKSKKEGILEPNKILTVNFGRNPKII